jgi:hypothetical protein
MRGRLSRIDRVLAVLLVVTVVEALAWCFAVPPMQGADELEHYAYVARIVEAHSIPWLGGGTVHKGFAYSTEEEVASRCAGLFGLEQNLSARAPGSVIDEHICYHELATLGGRARGDVGATSADRNPPAYYLYEAVPYLLTRHTTLFTRVFVMRVANILPLAALVVFVWLLAGELLCPLPRGPALRALATAAVVFNPQLMDITAEVNPDVFLSATFAAGLWLSVVVVRRGLTRGRLAWLIVLCALAGLTHGRGLALLAPAALAVSIALWRTHRPRSRPAIAGVAAGALAAIAVGAYLLLRYAEPGGVTLTRTGDFLSYIWQFYLPKLGFMAPSIHPGYGVRQVFIERFLGTFGLLETHFQPGTLGTLNTLADVAAVMAVIGLVVHRRRLRRALAPAAVLIAGALASLLLLHVVAYHQLLGNPGDPVITGRYLLPLLALYGVGMALAVSWLPRVLSAVLAGAVVAGLAVLQLSSLGLILERFYA